MARGNNNTWLLIILVVVLIGFGLYTMFGSAKHPKEGMTQPEEIEYVPQPDVNSQGAPEDDMEIIEAAEEPAHQIGFGMGPGLYGSGRHTSEMVGN